MTRRPKPPPDITAAVLRALGTADELTAAQLVQRLRVLDGLDVTSAQVGDALLRLMVTHQAQRCDARDWPTYRRAGA